MADDKLYREIMDYDEQMKQEKNAYEPVFNDIIDYVTTHQPLLYGDLEGKNRSEKQFDGTPRSALNIFTNGIHGLMVSPTMRWHRLKMADESLDNLQEVRIWLTDTEERLYNAFYRSNFYPEIKSYIRDGGSIGTACLYSQEELATGKLHFTTLPIRDYRIATDQYRRINRLHRDVKFTARELEQKFGYDNLTIPMQTALDATDRGIRLSKFEILHTVFPRTDTDVARIDRFNKPFASVWLAKAGEKNDTTKILFEGGLDMFPYTLWRFDSETGEMYGRSPAWHVLSEIKGAHVMEKDMLKATELAVKPPMNVHVNMRGNFKRIPDSINYFMHPDEKADAMNLGINLPAGYEYQERKRQIIREAWFVDFFLLIASREQTMTATEVLELQGEKISVLAPMVASLSAEALDHIIDRVFYLETQAGRLLPPPEILRGQKIDIEYLGPLAQLQKMRFETRGTQQALELLRPIVIDYQQIQVLDNINWDKITRKTMISAGFPPDSLLAEKEVRDLRDARQRVIAEREQAETAEIQSKSVKNVAQAQKNVGGSFTKAAEKEVTA